MLLSLHEVRPASDTPASMLEDTASCTQPQSSSLEVTVRRLKVTVGKPDWPYASNASTSAAGISAAPSSAKSHSIQASLRPWWFTFRLTCRRPGPALAGADQPSLVGAPGTTCTGASTEVSGKMPQPHSSKALDSPPLAFSASHDPGSNPGCGSCAPRGRYPPVTALAVSSTGTTMPLTCTAPTLRGCGKGMQRLSGPQVSVDTGQPGLHRNAGKESSWHSPSRASSCATRFGVTASYTLPSTL